MLRAHGRVGVTRGLGLHGVLTFSPSQIDTLKVYEIAGLGGLSWRFPLTQTLTVEPGVFGGVLQHIYALEGATNDSGIRWDLVGNLVVEVSWRVHRRLTLGLFASPGLATTDRTHDLSGERLWRRSWLRLEFGATLAFRLY